jgi:hypothetical protein
MVKMGPSVPPLKNLIFFSIFNHPASKRVNNLDQARPKGQENQRVKEE